MGLWAIYSEIYTDIYTTRCFDLCFGLCPLPMLQPLLRSVCLCFWHWALPHAVSYLGASVSHYAKWKAIMIRVIFMRSPSSTSKTERTQRETMATVGYQRKTWVLPRKGRALYPRWVMYAYHMVATAYSALLSTQEKTERLSRMGSRKYCTTYVIMKLQKKALACTSNAYSHSTSCSTLCAWFCRIYLLATCVHVEVTIKPTKSQSNRRE
mmetsp:Transcript_7877/g.17156  ORF Transcript_7877/g.17156 Transcript_7877/m.17156 type:complete len:210 (+) Transcript_7877:92-721(+)